MASDNAVFYFGPGRTDVSPIVSRFTQENELEVVRVDQAKELNDRYGYAYGDGVIRMLARILRDVVRGLAPGGFVGHSGVDDFIFNVPMEYLEGTCDEIIYLFDELISRTSTPNKIVARVIFLARTVAAASTAFRSCRCRSAS
jgi:GGDEF domain-containing protein